MNIKDYFLLFTFQYASIKPEIRRKHRDEEVDLHFNMLLLNQIKLHIYIEGNNHLHFNMLLLNLRRKKLDTTAQVNLHFNMLLLNRITCPSTATAIEIYISICFY